MKRSEYWWVRDTEDGDEMIVEVAFDGDRPEELMFCGSDISHYLDGSWGDDPNRYILLEKVPPRAGASGDK